MNIYAVGGAIRDELLGVPVQDRDYVVVGATPEQMVAQGYQSGRQGFSRCSCIRRRTRNTRLRAPSARRPRAITASSSSTRRTSRSKRISRAAI